MHATLSDILADVAANSIEAKASRIEVSVLEEGGRIALEVKDNGKGMPPEILARAFDPFYTEPGKHDKRKIGRTRGRGRKSDVCRFSEKEEQRPEFRRRPALREA